MSQGSSRTSGARPSCSRSGRSRGPTRPSAPGATAPAKQCRAMTADTATPTTTSSGCRRRSKS
eukprot:11178195-Lingulodinium_polyedra.AAC.1